MSYQASDETLPMVEGPEKKDGIEPTKKEGQGLAAFMVLCLALMSFLAGRAYSNSPVADASPSLGTERDECPRLFMELFWGSPDCQEYGTHEIIFTFNCLMDALGAPNGKSLADDCPMGGIKPGSICWIMVQNYKYFCY